MVARHSCQSPVVWVYPQLTSASPYESPQGALPTNSFFFLCCSCVSSWVVRHAAAHYLWRATPHDRQLSNQYMCVYVMSLCVCECVCFGVHLVICERWGLYDAWGWLSQYTAPPFIAWWCELLHTLSFRCRVLCKEAICTNYFKVFGDVWPGIWSHGLPHTRRALYHWATGASLLLLLLFVL